MPHHQTGMLEEESEFRAWPMECWDPYFMSDICADYDGPCVEHGQVCWQKPRHAM